MPTQLSAATSQRGDELSGRKILVTGASRGIGKAIAIDMARHGANVMCSGRNQSTLDETVGEIVAEGGVAESTTCDLSDPSLGRALVEETIARLGDLDVVVNNAGVGSAEGDALDEWQQIIAINLTAPFVICDAAAQHFQRKRAGSLINISSILGVVADPGSATAYVTAKHGLIGMSKNFAVQLAPFGIRVNVVGPGFVPTEMTKGDFEDAVMNQSIISRTPLGRWGLETDISGIVTFLASDAAAFITGQTICVDGGWTAI
jgi:NAD(P)-dependent dehydrogenase (short-subunit alcohol dehydrogenase family)